MSERVLRLWSLIHGFLIVALLVGTGFIPALHKWPLFWIVALAGYLLVVCIVPPLRTTFRPWQIGTATLPVGVVGIAATGIAFSLLNAVFEEIVFRGILFDAIAPWGRSNTIFLTSALFGLGHLHGYPPGLVGAILAGVFGAALSGLRLLTGGLGMSIATHVTADATIFILMVRSGVF
jgi:membrane protease YdiL (CAAX protease family)